MSDIDTDAVRALHNRWDDEHPMCAVCDAEFPCDAHRLADEVDRLRRERDENSGLLLEMRAAVTRFRREARISEAEYDNVLRILRRYGGHTGTCNAAWACDCGWSDVRAELTEDSPDEN